MKQYWSIKVTSNRPRRRPRILSLFFVPRSSPRPFVNERCPKHTHTHTQKKKRETTGLTAVEEEEEEEEEEDEMPFWKNVVISLRLSKSDNVLPRGHLDGRYWHDAVTKHTHTHTQNKKNKSDGFDGGRRRRRRRRRKRRRRSDARSDPDNESFLLNRILPSRSLAEIRTFFILFYTKKKNGSE